MELVARIFLATQGRAYSSSACRQHLRRRLAQMEGADVLPGEQALGERVAYAPHPYLAWEPEQVSQRIAHEIEHFGPGHDPACVDVLLLGSSVAAGLGNAAGDELLAACAQVAGLEGRPLQLFRHGRGSFKQPQQQILLAYLIDLGFEPDAVVDVDGFNELTSALQNHEDGLHPSYPTFSQWAPVIGLLATDRETMSAMVDVETARRRARSLVQSLERGPWLWSAVLGELARRRMERLDSEWRAGRKRLGATQSKSHRAEGVGGPPFAGDEQAYLRAASELWTRASIAMHQQCRARGIPYLHVLQPNPNVPGSKLLTEEERWAVQAQGIWLRAAQAGYPLLLAAAERLRGAGVAFLDATLVYADRRETIWVDAGHVGDAGNLILARFVGRALGELLRGAEAPQPDGPAPDASHQR